MTIAGIVLRNICLLVLSAALLKACYKEALVEDPEWWVSNRVLKLDQVYAFTDHEEKILLYTLPSDTILSYSPLVVFGDYESVEFNGMLLKEHEENDLGEVAVNQSYPVIARKGGRSESYQLYFTSLPQVHIHTETEILDEPKVISWLEIAYPNKNQGTKLFSSYAKIEIRGRSSAIYEKKSYGLNLWKDRFVNEQSADLLGMRYCEDWILDAMYVDPLRMRNKYSFEIWKKMWDGIKETPFLTSNPGIQAEHIELFINQRYMGLYCLTERLDENLLSLSAGISGSDGVIYKANFREGGSTAFETYNSEPGQFISWEGWEQVFPDGPALWAPLSELRKSVVLDEDGIFTQGIDTLLDLSVAADYYLFINLILAHDNIDKNYFLARYPDQSRFLFIPWDLEASWGIMWHGGESSTNGILTNKLYDRLMQLDVNEFNELLESKWEQYRKSIFQEDSLLAPVRRYVDLLNSSGAIGRENQRWNGVEIDLEREFLYYSQWTTRRLEYLDQVID